MSVLCRAWQVTKELGYLETAIGCLGPFYRSTEEHGVLGRISTLRVPWYEEWPQTRCTHVLNGMIYALCGLHDLVVVADHAPARALFEAGVESLVRAIPLFDSGYWSWYHLPEDRSPYYPASMMYQAMHFCQLTTLAQQTGREEFREYASRFGDYMRSRVCRLCAAVGLAKAKVITYGSSD